MGRIVSKFGGSSVADASQFLKIRKILESDPKRRIVVPSAPGKREPEESKLTDLLYLCHELAQNKVDFSSPFELIRGRFQEIESALGLKAGMEEALSRLEDDLRAGATKDHVASRGEYLCGRLMAAYLNAVFVDPKDCIFFDAAGRISEKSYGLLKEKCPDNGTLYVIPGFYGTDSKGRIKTFSRGGSDITGAIAAQAIGADLYENWTDVSGLLMADPRIVKSPWPMKEVSYREIRELAYMGANVFHDEAIAPARKAGIPIQIRNTNRPDDHGTRIVNTRQPSEYNIAGIAGKRHFSMFSLEKNMMNKERGFGRRLLGIFESHGISFEHCPTGIDTISVVVSQEELEDKTEAVLEDIDRILQPDKVELNQDLALIAVVGEGMIHQVGNAARVFTALRDASVNVRIIDQGSSEINIIVGVEMSDFEKAIRAIYSAFVEA